MRGKAPFGVSVTWMCTQRLAKQRLTVTRTEPPPRRGLTHLWRGRAWAAGTDAALAAFHVVTLLCDFPPRAQVTHLNVGRAAPLRGQLVKATRVAASPAEVGTGGR